MHIIICRATLSPWAFPRGWGEEGGRTRPDIAFVVTGALRIKDLYLSGGKARGRGRAKGPMKYAGANRPRVCAAT